MPDINLETLAEFPSNSESTTQIFNNIFSGYNRYTVEWNDPFEGLVSVEMDINNFDIEDATQVSDFITVVVTDTLNIDAHSETGEIEMTITAYLDIMDTEISDTFTVTITEAVEPDIPITEQDPIFGFIPEEQQVFAGLLIILIVTGGLFGLFTSAGVMGATAFGVSVIADSYHFLY